MPDPQHFDVAIIGTGPAGEAAAMKAAKSKKKVASIEAYSRVGGGATFWGTIPSKALRRAIYEMSFLSHSACFKNMDLVPQFSFPQFMAGTNQVVDQQAELRESFYTRNGIKLIHGKARFLDPHRIEIIEDKGARDEITADHVVIATGSRPYRPKDIDFNHPRIFDSDTILRMDFTPKSLIIYGAGVIGCEYASMFNMMLINTILVNTRDKLLSFLDDEIIDALAYHFADKGIRIMHSEEYERVEGTDDGVILHFKSGKKIKADAMLFCNGRSGNTEDLNLPSVGITPNARGLLAVNQNLQVYHNGTSPAPAEAADKTHGQAGVVGDPKKIFHAADTSTHDGQTPYDHIYAAGDIIGAPSLASASYDQGRFASTFICDGHADYRLVTEIPTGIYTTPEISSIGRTEAQLTAEKIPYEVGKAQFKWLARAQITRLRVGMLKIIFHRETLEILGIHAFGESATEIVHIGQAIMAQPAPHNTLKYFVTTTFNYPTMAEAYRVAALNGIDKLF